MDDWDYDEESDKHTQKKQPPKQASKTVNKKDGKGKKGMDDLNLDDLIAEDFDV